MSFQQVSITLGLLLLLTAPITAGDAPQSLAEQTATESDAPSTNVIYGADDRIEPFQATSPAELALFDATVALFYRSMVHPYMDGYDIDVWDYGTYSQYVSVFDPANPYPLCETEPFRDQPVPAFCSGFQAGPRLIVTSGNCIGSESDCADTAFVFGFHMIDPGTVATWVPDENVYFCEEIVGRTAGNTEDWSVVRVDRPITGHDAIPIRRSGLIESDPAVEQLALCGHPMGMPAKYAGNATVQGTHASYFSANLDSFAGNSGSSVVSLDINGELLWLEGILVRGNDDFVRAGDCMQEAECPDSGCLDYQGNPSWEESTRGSLFRDLIPACGDDFVPSSTYGRLLFGAECSRDAAEIPDLLEPYRSATATLHNGAGNTFYLSSSGTRLAPVIVDDELRINDTAVALGPYLPQGIGYPLATPLDDIWIPASPLDITALVPADGSPMLFEAFEADQVIYGHSALYLVRDCGIWLDEAVPGEVGINWVSHRVDIDGYESDPDIVTGSLSDLRADQDFSAACHVGSFSNTRRVALPGQDPPPGDGYYYLEWGTCNDGTVRYGRSSLDPDPRATLTSAPSCN